MFPFPSFNVFWALTLIHPNVNGIRTIFDKALNIIEQLLVLKLKINQILNMIEPLIITHNQLPSYYQHCLKLLQESIIIWKCTFGTLNDDILVQNAFITAEKFMNSNKTYLPSYEYVIIKKAFDLLNEIITKYVDLKEEYEDIYFNYSETESETNFTDEEKSEI